VKNANCRVRTIVPDESEVVAISDGDKDLFILVGEAIYQTERVACN
jgi:hypothetical protein